MKLTTREDAKNLGLKRFFDNVLCIRSHTSERFVVDNSCCQCRLERIREKRKDPEFRKNEIKKEMDKRKNDISYKEKRNKTSLNCFLKKIKDPEFKKLEKEKNKKWRQSEVGRQWVSNYLKQKMNDDPIFVMSSRVRSRIKEIFRKKGYKKNGNTEKMLGCSFVDFGNHIEKQFLKGMTWENRSLWHIDHIIPLHEAKNELDVVSLSHFTNLRPMWAKENLVKNKNRTHLI